MIPMNDTITKAIENAEERVYAKYRPVIDLVYKLYCVPSQSDETMRQILVKLKEIGHVNTSDIENNILLRRLDNE